MASVRGAGVYSTQRNRSTSDIDWKRPTPTIFPHLAALLNPTDFFSSYSHLWSLIFQFFAFLFWFYFFLLSAPIIPYLSVCFSLHIHPPCHFVYASFYVSISLPSQNHIHLAWFLFESAVTPWFTIQYLCLQLYVSCVVLYVYREMNANLVNSWSFFFIIIIYNTLSMPELPTTWFTILLDLLRPQSCCHLQHIRTGSRQN